jgi:hypothetical protein
MLVVAHRLFVGLVQDPVPGPLGSFTSSFCSAFNVDGSFWFFPGDIEIPAS